MPSFGEILCDLREDRRLTQTQLAHTLFPLGNMKKTEVRAVAEKAGFVNATKPDS